MIAVFLLFLNIGYPEYFEMVDKQLKEGYTFEYVGRTVVTDEVALPTKEQDGTLIYYWYLTESKRDE